MVIGEDIQQEMLASLQTALIKHSQITRVTLFIKLFLVCLLSPQQRWCFNGLKGKWEWIETWVRVEWDTKIWASNWIIEKKVKVNWTLRQTWVRHMFTWRPAGSCTHRRQNGTILGKFRWKTKTSCFDAKLVLTQPASASVEVSWRREGSRLKTSCFAQRKSTITTAAQLWAVSSAGQSCFDWEPPGNFKVKQCRHISIFTDGKMSSESSSTWIMPRIRMMSRSENFLQTSHYASLWPLASSNKPCTSLLS